MQTRLQLLHSWTDQLQSLLPQVRVTRVRGLALLSLGLLWAGRVPLSRIAAALPLPVQDLSTERRLRRWLANAQIPVVATWLTRAAKSAAFHWVELVGVSTSAWNTMMIHSRCARA